MRPPSQWSALAAAARAAAAAAATAGWAAEDGLRRGAVNGEARELLQHLRRTALGARHGLIRRTDELLEVRLALHAGVLVDRHEPSVLSRAVAAWTAPTLEGRIVRLEPLRTEHEEGLWLASRDPRTWRWLSVVQPQTHAQWRAFVAQALAAADAGAEIPFATVAGARVVGST